MRRTGSTMIVSDGCRSGHSQEVKDLCEDEKIDLYPLTSEVKGGYPPYRYLVVS